MISAFKNLAGKNPLHVAIVYDRADALSLEDAAAFDFIVSLTPDATGSLDRTAAQVFDSTNLFSDYGHARALVHRRRLHRAMAELDLAPECHPEILGNYILNQFDQSVSFAARLQESFRHFCDDTRFSIRGKTGQWSDVTGKDQAIDFLFRRFSVSDEDRGTENRMVAPGLYRMLVLGVVKLIARRGTWCVCTQTGLPFGLDGTLYAEPHRIRRLVIQFGAETKSYGRLLLRLLEFIKEDRSTFTIEIPEQVDPATRGMVAKVLGRLEPSILPAVYSAVSGPVVDAATDISGSSGFIRKIIGALKPKATISYQTSSRMEHALSIAAKMSSVPRLVLNYNSHTLSKGACSEFSNHGHYQLKVWNALSDRVLTWSPSNAALVSHLQATSMKKSVTAIRAMTTTPYDVAEKGLAVQDRPVVLHAGSFLSWNRTLLWCLETSDEYAASIVSFADAARDIDGIEAVVRCKRKGEGGGEAIARVLPDDAPVTMQGLDRPFKDVLPEVTVLISFMSTVIEEAIAARTPVLLWGPTERYLHLAPQRVPPTGPDDRAAVYTTSDRPSLVAMLKGIVAAHAKTPLTDAEIAPYVFDTSMPGTEAVASWIETNKFPELHPETVVANG